MRSHKFHTVLYIYIYRCFKRLNRGLSERFRKKFENIHSLLDLLEYYHLEILLLTKRFN